MSRRFLIPLAFAASLIVAQLALAQVAILNGANSVAAGAIVSANRTAGAKTYSVWGSTTAGTGTAVVSIEGSMNSGLSWDSPPICSVTLSLSTTTASNGCTSQDKYLHLRGNVTSISGTGASVSLTAGF